MHITSSNVALAATHVHTRKVEQRATVDQWVDPRPQPVAASAQRSEQQDDEPLNGATQADVDIAILESAFGTMRVANAARAIRESFQSARAASEGYLKATSPQPREGWGLRIEVSETTTEAETMQFVATAQIQTADGHVINAQAALSMERVNISTSEFQLLAGDEQKVDPLVLNLSAGAASFDGTHQFDLNADGKTEKLSALASTSAYLALDKNHDGRVENGSELFGPSTGDGFGELRALDTDGNGWVDEADPAFADLRLMFSSGTVSSLSALQVGAIYTGFALTPFEVKDTAGSAQASVAQTGIFVRENGTLGTVQHLDLVV